MFRGIDVSKWQGKIDWNKVKPQIDFAIIRAGYGKNTVDPFAERNVNECERLAIPYGLYWFSYAYTPAMAQSEADSLLAFIGTRKPQYPLYFDFEGASYEYAQKRGITITKEKLSEITFAFCRRLEERGFYTGVYTNEDYRKNRFEAKVFKAFDMWYARYAKSITIKANIWQYTSQGAMTGINGYVDRNSGTVDYPALMVRVHKNGY